MVSKFIMSAALVFLGVNSYADSTRHYTGYNPAKNSECSVDIIEGSSIGNLKISTSFTGTRIFNLPIKDKIFQDLTSRSYGVYLDSNDNPMTGRQAEYHNVATMISLKIVDLVQQDKQNNLKIYGLESNAPNVPEICNF